MHLVKNIFAFILGMIFLVSSSGFLIYKSHCSCTGNEQVSMFVNLEVCESQKHDSNEDDMEMSCCSSKETKQYQAHSTDCDCDKPEITYIKLTNNVVNEEVKFTRIEPVQMLVAYTIVQYNLWETDESLESDVFYIDPPPIHYSSLDFLIHIQQLKIPYIA